MALDDNENADDVIHKSVCDTLNHADRSVLVFVYQTRSANSLAKSIADSMGGPNSALPYHSQMSSSQRKAVRDAYCSGYCKCVVATTSLAMGVNLPATDVFIRDITFPGVGKLSIAELLQMAGRAGRGNQSGNAFVLRRHLDAWSREELVQQLSSEPLPALQSSFSTCKSTYSDKQPVDDGLLEVLTTHLARFPDGQTSNELRSFFDNSLGGHVVAGRVDEAIDWLSDPCRLLVATNDDGRYVCTALGMRAIRSTLPLRIAAGIGHLVRDLLEIDDDDKFLAAWSPLDHLITLELLSDRSPSLRRFSKQLEKQVVGWIEGFSSEKPLLFREWIHGDSDHSKASELTGSLGLDSLGDVDARKSGYLATFRSIILFDRGRGARLDDIKRRWEIENLEGIEEQWRDRMLWLLNAMAQVLETRCFYFHLKENCGATIERVKRVETVLRRMRFQTFELQQQLKYCSPLGGILRSIRRVQGKRSGVPIGIGSIRRLENAGITSLVQLTQMTEEELVNIGLRRSVAKQLRVYLRRRCQ